MSKKIFAIISMVLFVLVCFYAFSSKPVLERFFMGTTFYFICALVGIWFYTIIQRYLTDGEKFRRGFRRILPALGVGLFFAGFIFLSVGSHYRVLSDETNLLGDAKGMFDRKTVGNVTMGEWYYNSFYFLREEIPKRPLVYPFFIYLAHLFLGFNAINGFIVNALFAVVFFTAAFYLSRKQYGFWGALSACFLLCAQPVLILAITSSGFDFFATFFIFLSFLALKEYFDDPSEKNLVWLWISLMMLGNVRHESFIVFITVTACLFLWKKIRWRELSWETIALLSLTPWFILPVACQRIIHQGAFETPPGVAAWSLQYLVQNTIKFFRYQFDTEFLIPYATLFNLIGIAGAVHLLYRALNKRGSTAEGRRQLLIAMFASLAAVWVVITSFHRGNMEHPSDSRYFAVYAAILSLAGLNLLLSLPVLKSRKPLVFVISFFVFCIYHPISVSNKFTYMQTLPRAYAWTLEVLDRAADKHSLIVSDRPGLYSVHNRGSVSFQHMNANKHIILNNINRHLYSDVFVIQEIGYEDRKPLINNDLDPEYKLEPIAQIQNKPTSYIQISKITNAQAS